MIVIGTDAHKRTHTCGAVEATSGRALAERTAPARRRGFDELLRFGRGLGGERVWAIEDCRHVSGSFERFLIARGERVVRVAPKLMAGARSSARERGKSDAIDAIAVARAALREGLETLPQARLEGRALEIRVLLDHHDDLVQDRSDDQRRLRWHLHDLWPELEVPAGALDRDKWLGRIARRLGRERVWAIEDCRHVSGAFERFLIARGERVVRVAPKLMAGARSAARERGKSDAIDAVAVARAALREGLEALPQARLEGRSLEIRVLLDHRDNLVADRSDDQRRLRWHLHDLWPELEIPAGALDRDKWLARIARRLRRAEQGARVRVARELVRQIGERTRRVRALERELLELVRQEAPALLELSGCGPLTAAKLVGEIAGAERFASDAKLARLAGVAPIPASSGRTDRHRLDRGGNRQLRLAVNQGKRDPRARAFLARKQAEGKGRMEALRSLKRQLVRVVFRILRAHRGVPSASPVEDEKMSVTVHAGVPLGMPCLT